MKKTNLFFKRDIFIIAGILALAVGIFLFIQFNKVPGASVVVKIDGNTVETYPLDKNGIYELNNGTHELHIVNGEAYLTEASCPDHVCINQGKIAYNGETITCLPYRLTITVSSDKAPSVELIS